MSFNYLSFIILSIFHLFINDYYKNKTVLVWTITVVVMEGVTKKKKQKYIHFDLKVFSLLQHVQTIIHAITSLSPLPSRHFAITALNTYQLKSCWVAANLIALEIMLVKAKKLS